MHAIAQVNQKIRPFGLLLVLLLVAAPRLSATRRPAQNAEQPSCFSDYAVAW
jgi:hypothetical protein